MIPIAFSVGIDPVAVRLVASLLRPGGNLTGFSIIASERLPLTGRDREAPLLPWRLLTSLPEKLIKIGATVISHGRYVTFQLAEAAVSRQMFADILSLIARLRAPPLPA